MQAAEQAARRSNCIRRGVGAVIVRSGEILSMGWNGVSERYSNCRQAGCPRCIEGGATGSGYELCICLHAEQRAIGDAAARGVNTSNSTLYVNLRPCLQCLGVMKSAGIREVFFDEDWIYSEPFEAIYQEQAREFQFFGQIAPNESAASRIRRIA
jgi:dCMP deaminase